MDENPLIDQQQMQANLVSQAFLQDTAREQQRKLEKLEAMYAVAHHGLVSFLTLLDPDFIDTCLKQGQTISKLDDRIVQQQVLLAIKVLKEKLALPGQFHLTDANGSQSATVELVEENRLLRQHLEKDEPGHHRTATRKRKTSRASLSNRSGYSKGTRRRSGRRSIRKVNLYPQLIKVCPNLIGWSPGGNRKHLPAILSFFV